MPEQPRTSPKRPLPPLSPLTEAERRASLAGTLAAAPEGPTWVFAYGSLMWRPCFAFDERIPAWLEGYRRSFNFWSVLARGTPERPGLGMGLEPGGVCQGVLYRLPEASRAADLEALWAREMLGSVYAPHWLPVETPGGIRTAICFLINPAHDYYAGPLPSAAAAAIIARAAGANGRCRDYLALTLEALAAHGLSDPALEALLALVDGQPPESER